MSQSPPFAPTDATPTAAGRVPDDYPGDREVSGAEYVSCSQCKPRQKIY